MSWYLGPAKVPCEHSYNHLGIVVNHKCKLSDRIHEACSKGRKTYIALSDLSTKFLNPNVALRLLNLGGGVYEERSQEAVAIVILHKMNYCASRVIADIPCGASDQFLSVVVAVMKDCGIWLRYWSTDCAICLR